MSARVLVVDDIAANVRLLEAKLLLEYYEVISAGDGPRALELVRGNAPDIVLLDVMMPGMDGFEVCRRIKADPETMHIPVVMVTALNDVKDRVHGLEAGADDFLTKPVNDVVMLARIRSLVRMKRAGDEWRTREATLVQFRGEEEERLDLDTDRPGRILLALDDPAHDDTIRETLAERGHQVSVVSSSAEALEQAVHGRFDLIIADDWIGKDDGLRLCSQLRSDIQTRNDALLLIVQEGEVGRLAKALEVGVNDYLMRPIDRGEVLARIRTQVRRKHYEDGLRANYEQSLAAALSDSLTGLNNRRYLEAHFQGVSKRLAESGKPLALMILDVDHFKQVNDAHGHAVGDEVLRSIAKCILANCRGFDTAVRFGGEEFVVFMPASTREAATVAAERLREEIGTHPMRLETGAELAVTVSIGVCAEEADAITLETLLHAADMALYRAKNAGRNRVEVAAAAHAATPQPRAAVR